MNKIVLIIEDNQDILENAKEILQLANYTVHTAPNGKAGLELAQKTDPDIILCDIMMPELDGYGVLRGLANNPKTRNVPFIFISAKTEKKDFRMGMDLGADDYLAKPFSGDDLLSLISTRLKKADSAKNQRDVEGKRMDTFSLDAQSIQDLITHNEKVITRRIRKKDILFNEGDSAKYLHYILSGKIKTLKINEQGKEYITRIYKEHEFIGYSSLLDASVYTETAEAIEECEIASIAHLDLFDLAAAEPGFCHALINVITSNLSESNEKLLGLAYNSARKRVAEAILYMANKYDPSPADGMCFSVSRENLSAISGVSPESVSRNLTDLRMEHLIELSNGHIRILNVKKLVNLRN